MRNQGRMDVPKEFLLKYYGKDSNPERRKGFEEWIKTKREKLKREPAYDSIQAATNKAVSMAKAEPLSNPSVWREPSDVGEKITVVKFKDRENAYVAGYKEVVDGQTIYDIANGRETDGIDTIEEVDDK